MREEECSWINCAEESYGAGCWLVGTASGVDLSARLCDEGACYRGAIEGRLSDVFLQVDLLLCFCVVLVSLWIRLFLLYLCADYSIIHP